MRPLLPRLTHTSIVTAALSTALACRPHADVLSHPLDAATTPAIAQFEAKWARDVAQDSVGGMVAAVTHGGNLVWAKAFGWADRERRITADVDGIYRIGSISKTFTALLLMQLVEQQVVQMDDRVIDHLPEFSGLAGPPQWISNITLRHLATHTSGLAREPGLEGAASGPIDEWEDKILASIPTTTLESPPGEEYSYSNVAFGILGLALSRAARAPYMELVERLIFEPLGMESSTFVVGSELAPRLATGYENRRDGSVDREQPAREHAGRGYKVPNGGIYSTVSDLGRFVGGLLGVSEAEILAIQSGVEMRSVQTPTDGPRYGVGLSIMEGEDGTLLFGHGGSVAGYTARLAFEPETRLGVILLRNYARGNTDLRGDASALLEAIVRLWGT